MEWHKTSDFLPPFNVPILIRLRNHIDRYAVARLLGDDGPYFADTDAHSAAREVCEEPLTEKPLGTITRSQDGYLWIKLSSIGRRRCDNWMQLQRYVWEFHNGPIPEGMLVAFPDANKDQCDISNLALVTRRSRG